MTKLYNLDDIHQPHKVVDRFWFLDKGWKEAEMGQLVKQGLWHGSATIILSEVTQSTVLHQTEIITLNNLG